MDYDLVIILIGAAWLQSDQSGHPERLVDYWISGHQVHLKHICQVLLLKEPSTWCIQANEYR